MTWIERVIALAIIVVLFIFAIAQQIELAKIKTVVLQIQNTQQNVPPIVETPTPIPIPTIDQSVVNKLVSKAVPRHMIHKHKKHRRAESTLDKIGKATTTKIYISRLVLEDIIQDQNNIMMAQQGLINSLKAVAASNNKISELKIKTLELKNTSLELELKASKAKCQNDKTFNANISKYNIAYSFNNYTNNKLPKYQATQFKRGDIGYERR